MISRLCSTAHAQKTVPSAPLLRAEIAATRPLEIVMAEKIAALRTWLAREGRFDYFLVESTGISESLPVAEPRLGRRTALTLPLFPPPQKN
jgi:hypothetical protein